jgi:hypothetical protein
LPAIRAKIFNAEDAEDSQRAQEGDLPTDNEHRG